MKLKALVFSDGAIGVLHTKPEYRRRGYAKCLISAVALHMGHYSMEVNKIHFFSESICH